MKLLSPPATLASIVAIVLLVATAWKYRKKAPVYTFAVFWFLGGHILESTVVPLELYIEHRNYLPLLGPIFAVIYFAVQQETRPCRPRTLHRIFYRINGLRQLDLGETAGIHHGLGRGKPDVNTRTTIGKQRLFHDT